MFIAPASKLITTKNCAMTFNRSAVKNVMLRVEKIELFGTVGHNKSMFIYRSEKSGNQSHQQFETICMCDSGRLQHKSELILHKYLQRLRNKYLPNRTIERYCNNDNYFELLCEWAASGRGSGCGMKNWNNYSPKCKLELSKATSSSASPEKLNKNHEISMHKSYKH